MKYLSLMLFFCFFSCYQNKVNTIHYPKLVIFNQLEKEYDVACWALYLHYGTYNCFSCLSSTPQRQLIDTPCPINKIYSCHISLDTVKIIDGNALFSMKIIVDDSLYCKRVESNGKFSSIIETIAVDTSTNKGVYVKEFPDVWLRADTTDVTYISMMSKAQSKNIDYKFPTKIKHVFDTLSRGKEYPMNVFLPPDQIINFEKDLRDALQKEKIEKIDVWLYQQAEKKRWLP